MIVYRNGHPIGVCDGCYLRIPANIKVLCGELMPGEGADLDIELLATTDDRPATSFPLHFCGHECVDRYVMSGIPRAAEVAA